MNNTKQVKVVKVEGQDVTVKKLSFRLYHFSAVVDGQYLSATHYSHLGFHKIRKLIKAVA